jgi:hypothetical protein
MNRVKDVTEALDKIRNLDEVTDETAKEIHLALLGHIALCLAVIADKMTEEVTE